MQTSTASSTESQQSARARLAISALFAVGLITLAAGDAAHLSALSVIGVIACAFMGVGAATVQLSSSIGLPARAGVACVLGLCTLTIVGSVMVLVPFWHPVPVAAVLAGAAAVAHAVGVRRALEDIGSNRGRRLAARLKAFGGSLHGAGLLSLGCTALGTSLWLVSALLATRVVPGNGGFLRSISVLWYVGIIAVVAGIALARRAPESFAAAAVVSLVGALTITPALVYGMPEVQTAGKHIELVQTILHTHRLHPGAGIYDAYSGFFSAIAWLCALARVKDSLGIATFWPFIVGLIGLVELRWLLGAVIRSPFRIWAAATLAILANTVEESYFSPQSVGLVLGVGIFAIVLDRSAGATAAKLRAAVLPLAGCALAVTHELSPFIVGGVLVVLALARCGRPRWAAAAILVPAGAWALVNRSVVSSFVSLSNLLSLSNFEPPKLATPPGLARAAVSIASFDALVLGLLVLCVLAAVGWLRNRGKRWAWGCVLAAAVGLAFTAVNPYNNEGIYRAILFAIPWLGVLAAHALGARAGRWAPAAFAVIAIGMLATFCVATFTLDGFTVIRRADLTALRRFEVQAPPGSGYVDLGFNEVPFAVATSRDPDIFINWQTLLTGKKAFFAPPSTQTVSLLTRRFEAYVRARPGARARSLYALWSPTSAVYAADYGLMSRADARAWRGLMLRSPLWTISYASQGTYLFKFVAPTGRRP